MTLRKITVDNSVSYIPITEKTKEKEIKPKMIKAGSLPRKQKKNISQNSKKNFLKTFQLQDSNILQNSICTNIRINILLIIYE